MAPGRLYFEFPDVRGGVTRAYGFLEVTSNFAKLQEQQILVKDVTAVLVHSNEKPVVLVAQVGYPQCCVPCRKYQDSWQVELRDDSW